jgi:hypothetical protein
MIVMRSCQSPEVVVSYFQRSHSVPGLGIHSEHIWNTLY